MIENKGLVNLEGKQHCSICESTFAVYSNNEGEVNFCPHCGARSDNFVYDEEK